MATPDDPNPSEGRGDPEGSLLEALSGAGAAVDRAQITGDLAAHRIVQLVARCADDPRNATDAVAGPLAREGESVTAAVALAASRYELARGQHADALDRLAAPPDARAVHELRTVARLGDDAEADAVALLAKIDAAERALDRQSPRAGSSGGVLPAADPLRYPPDTHLH